MGAGTLLGLGIVWVAATPVVWVGLGGQQCGELSGLLLLLLMHLGPQLPDQPLLLFMVLGTSAGSQLLYQL